MNIHSSNHHSGIRGSTGKRRRLSGHVIPTVSGVTGGKTHSMAFVPPEGIHFWILVPNTSASDLAVAQKFFKENKI